MNIRIGADASATFTVTDDDTAIALGSGDVPVLATPRILAWCEAVTVTALTPELDDASTSVGFRVELDHLLPTPVGATVRVRAEVTGVDGRRVTFAVTADDGDHAGTDAGAAATATVVRVVVDRQRFIDRLS